MGPSRIKLAAVAKCLLLVVSLAAGSRLAPGQVEETQDELMTSQFFREALENLEQEGFLRNSLGRAGRPLQLRQPEKQARAYTVMQLDEEGRARRTSRDQIFRSDIMGDVIERILHSAEKPNQQQQPIQEIVQGPRTIYRVASEPESMLEEPSDLSIPIVDTKLAPGLVSRQELPGLAWPSRGELPRRQPGSTTKRFQLNGIEFRNENEQQAAEEVVGSRVPYTILAVRKPSVSRTLNVYRDDNGGQTNKTNDIGGHGKQNKFVKPDTMMANMVGNSLEAKRVENSRWNNLRGMWGKRSVKM